MAMCSHSAILYCGTGLGGGRKELVSFDAGCNTAFRLVGLDANYLAIAANANVAGLGDLPGQRKHKLNRNARFVLCIGDEIEAAEADIARTCRSLDQPSRSIKTHR